MARLYLLLFVVDLVVTVAALIDCLGSEAEPRHLSRLIWVLIILIFSPIGGIAWFLVGRERTEGPVARWRPRSEPPERQRSGPLAPDDDPAFLESLRDRRGSDDELFRRWEADLRRREDDLRRHTDADRPPDDQPSAGGPAQASERPDPPDDPRDNER